MIDWKRKLSSRKFWVTVAGFITSIAAGLGWDVNPEHIMAAVMGIFALYLIIEGVIDAKH